jgi:hypothetical protein
MTSEELEYIALVCAYEDSNPCEIPSDVRRFLPDSPDIVALSRSAVLTLLQRGFVILAQGAEYFVCEFLNSDGRAHARFTGSAL